MKFISVGILVILVFHGFSQEKDFQIWSSFEIGTKLNKKIGISFEEELRFDNNSTQLSKYYSQPGITFKFSKQISAGIAYRFIQQYKTNRTISTRHYYIAEISYDNKFNRFKYKTRCRYVSKYSAQKTEETIIIPANYIRQKFDLSYNVKGLPLNPFVSFEVFFPLNNPFGNFPDNCRTAIGAEYDITKKQSVSISFLNDLEINVENPMNAYVLALKYKIEF